ncbi:Ig-like domain-containing protein [Caulobacter sp. NIBR2454]|uniref:Ig-like domain-containing protein n=1 Tax=Caulobacter sp. NIBR2454 TaxID=3015996 RepID=UPI0022B75506|nr:Ig-like domain-containing protein [Caulobacter sp. NIBR2454]
MAIPTTTVVTAQFSADSGISNTDLITNVASQTLSGTTSTNLVAGESVYLSFNNGGSWNPATTSTGSNAWSLSVTLGGSGTFLAVVRNTDGDSTQLSTSYVLDTTAPSTTAASLSLSADTGTSSTDFVTKTASQTISGTLSANLAADETVWVSVDNGATWASASASVGSSAWSLAGATLAGSNRIVAKVMDSAGNSGAGYSYGYVLDITAPATSVASLRLSADTGVSALDLVTKTAAQTISGTLSANLAAGERVLVSTNNGATWAEATASVGSSGWSYGGVTLTGSDTIQVQVADSAGNGGAILSQAYVLDTTAPTIAVTSNVSTLKAGETATITFTLSEADHGSFTIADAVVSGGVLSGFSGSGSVYTATFTPTAGVNGGTASITATANSYIDLAGNFGAGGSLSPLTFDTLAPSAPSTPDLSAGSDTGASNTDNVTSDSTPTFNGTSEANATITLYDTDGTTELGTTTASAMGAWSITASTLSAGAHTLTAKAADAAGNVSTASTGLSITIDLSTPAAPSTPVLSVASDTGTVGDGQTDTTTPVITGTASANAVVKLFDGSTLVGSTTADGGGAWSITTSTLAAGAHNLTATQTNLAGTTSAASAALALTIGTIAPPVDETPPEPPAPDYTAPEIRENFAAAAGLQPNSPKTTIATVTLADGTVVANPTYETALQLSQLILRFEAGLISRERLIDEVVDLSAPTSGVALQAYQFFTGLAPSKAGLAYLIDSPANANDLTDAYYARFNEVNRFINFAVSLGVEGEGRAAFEAKFGGLDFAASVRLAYDMVIGLDAARTAGVDVDAALAWISSQESYFDLFAGSDLGGKAAMVGYIMQAGFEARVGRYYEASHDFLEDAFDGTPTYQVDLVGGQHLGG